MENTGGQKRGVAPKKVQSIIRWLSQKRKHRDLALFTLGIDSMLRGVDLLALRVRDITDRKGRVVVSFAARQQKTKERVHPALTVATRKALTNWIDFSGKEPNDFLFTHTARKTNSPLTTSALRRLVKGWCKAVGLDPEHYSGHSLRRTKAAYLYKSGVEVADIATMLGHTSTASTLRYLGITTERVQAIALSHDIFKSSVKPLKSSTNKKGLSHEDMETLADLVAKKLFQKLNGI